MATFTLVVRPDGQAILTTPRPLPDDAAVVVREAFEEWGAGVYRVLVLPECEVVRIETLEIRLPGEVPA